MSDKQKNWYQRQHPFAPYTRAEGEAVAAELDAIQASFERIPEMRDDGKGFKVSPVVPTPTEPDHAVPLKLLSETEQSVYRSREVATTKAQEATAAAQTAVGKANEASTSAATATRQADVATSKATAAATSESNASTSANLARRWASEAENTQVANGKYSAMHYALKADASKTAAETARQQAVQKAQEVATHAQQVATNAQTSTTKAQEATAAAQTAVGKLAEIQELDGEIAQKASTVKNAADFISIAIGQATEAKNESHANKEAAAASARQAADSVQQANGSAQAAAASATQTATLKTQTESLKTQTETAKNAAEQSATVAQDAANRASAIAGGSIDYSKILNVPTASTTTKGIAQLTNDTGLDSENLGLSAKGGKKIAQSVAQLQQRVNDGLDQKVNKTDISDVVNSESRISVASSKAVKTAYDKGESAFGRANQVFDELTASIRTAQTTAQSAQTAAQAAQSTANSAQSAASGNVAYSRITGVPNATTSARGVTQLYSGYNSPREDLALSAKGGKDIFDYFNSRIGASPISGNVERFSELTFQNGNSKMIVKILHGYNMSTVINGMHNSFSYNFPVAFPNACLSIDAVPVLIPKSGANVNWLEQIDFTGMYAFARAFKASYGVHYYIPAAVGNKFNVNFRVIAIGY